MPKKSVAPVAPAAKAALLVTALRLPAVHAVRPVPLAPLPMAATNPPKHLVLTPNPPLSAFAKSPRQLQQLTVKENNHVATRSPEIPQRAEGP